MDARVAAGRFEDAAEHADDRRLTGAVWAEETEDRLFRDGEADVIDRGKVAKLLRQVGALNHQITGAAAERLNWTDRGWVRRGCAADLVILDGSTLHDTATFEQPARFPTGIEHVF